MAASMMTAIMMPSTLPLTSRGSMKAYQVEMKER